jgi:hypothetical protein
MFSGSENSFCSLLSYDTMWYPLTRSHIVITQKPFLFLVWGETESTWHVGHCLPYCTSPGWWSVWSSRWNENWQGKPKYSEKTCPSAALSTTDATWHDLVSNPGRCCGKPATNRLSYGTANPEDHVKSPHSLLNYPVLGGLRENDLCSVNNVTWYSRKTRCSLSNRVCRLECCSVEADSYIQHAILISQGVKVIQSSRYPLISSTPQVLEHVLVTLKPTQYVSMEKWRGLRTCLRKSVGYVDIFIISVASQAFHVHLRDWGLLKKSSAPWS